MNSFKAYKVTYLLLGLALIIYAYATITYYRYDWYPVSTPIPALNQPVTAQFKADLAGNYRVYIRFDNSENTKYWQCAFGTAAHHFDCSDVRDIAVEWKVLSGDTLIDHGVATGPDRRVFGSLGQGPDASNIAYIRTLLNNAYRVEVVVKGPPSTIRSTKPYLKVDADQGRHKDAGITRMLLSNLALIVAMIAALAAIITYRIRRKYTASL